MNITISVNAVHLFALVLATWRITELFTQDRITAKLRSRFPLYLWTCPRCMSVWAGIVATAMFVASPWLNWPLALSWGYITMMSYRQDKVIFKIMPNQTLRLMSSDINQEGLNRELRRLLQVETPTIQEVSKRVMS